jgi:acetylornithine deacetylase/succinyl-diaminopimelate desuccinylase-like protein
MRPALRLGVGALAALAAVTLSAAQPARTLDLTMEAGERWWIGVTSESHRMPMGPSSPRFEIDLEGNTAGNQVQPLLLSSTGRYVWSDEPFRLTVDGGKIHVASSRGAIESGRYGTTLREAARQVAAAHFPASGKIPDPLLFTRPQFNTWIELTYNQNQRDVLAYAHAIVDQGFDPGVLMIDEGWFKAYGVWDFDRARFPDPKAMMDELHGLGFKVMLWVCPYIRPDGQDFTVLMHDRSRTVWLKSAKDPAQPAIMQWWDGYSAVVDLTSPAGRDWFTGQLHRLVETYGVDGFKLDGGDAELFAQSAMLNGAVAHDPSAGPNDQTEAFARIGLEFPLNEYRAMWKMGGQPLAERLRDKEHTWEDMRKLVPGILTQGVIGYPFACPDMIGGGEYLSFENLAAVDQELIVRAAEVHALMPMMQFSVAPWRVLSAENLAITRRMAALHTAHADEIVALARESAKTGDPIARPLDYQFPGHGYDAVVDEFLLGPDILVAPVVEKGARTRRLVVPPGRWTGDDGTTVVGPAEVRIDVPLERLPWYRRSGGPQAMAGSPVSQPTDSKRAGLVRQFAELLAIPNVASDTANIRRNAEYIAAQLQSRGVEARLLEGDGPPIVFGELKAPGARRTVAIYAHYDGQPVDPSQWATPPWSPVVRKAPVEANGDIVPLASLPEDVPGDWWIYGRSAGDDKAPIAAILAALDRLKAAGHAPTVNLKFFFEGEEEAGSPHLAASLDRYDGLLATDVWLLCDGPVHQSRRPQVFYGARGTLDLEMTVYGPTRTLHSGHYGNWAPNPAALVSSLLASMRDRDARITIDGYYDDVTPLTEAEKAAIAAMPDVDAQMKRELHLGWTEGAPEPLPMRITHPALNIRGIEVGHVGTRAQNAVPTEARASIDFRLVPDQRLERVKALVEAHIRAQGFDIVHEKPTDEERLAHARLAWLAWGTGYPAARTAMDLPVSKALVGTIEEARRQPVIQAPLLGGSIPMYLFLRRAPVIGLPVANHDDNQHAPNENLRLQNLYDAVDVFAAVMTRLDSHWR